MATVGDSRTSVKAKEDRFTASIWVRVTPSMRDQVMTKANSENTVVSMVIRQLLEVWLTGNS